ncbi:hypothetical protein P168DRAFT_23377 [Aspergillus campestris IBT 28561]|uniref:Uncharacterized protein n=1 Tax=Aspergillus campestris (strain IBT 28561) TaxID=1392248 RepID=A0A2I1DG11_ASPC2|nr:uncharacterized protein P168DRAFT_23377 [Aspergillus campestris IBT 28561]PKY08808.1 hypothetical protein P168DRAFT_23377 [Aspergillus campestris IBT 28561]
MVPLNPWDCCGCVWVSATLGFGESGSVEITCTIIDPRSALLALCLSPSRSLLVLPTGDFFVSDHMVKNIGILPFSSLIIRTI